LQLRPIESKTPEWGRLKTPRAQRNKTSLKNKWGGEVEVLHPKTLRRNGLDQWWTVQRESRKEENAFCSKKEKENVSATRYFREKKASPSEEQISSVRGKLTRL